MKRCLAHTFGGEIPHVPSTVIKDTCLAACMVLLAYYQILESKQFKESVRIADKVTV